MQTANFRDDVMLALARKMGGDPTVDFPPDLALTYLDFVNAWMRRLWPSFDWPEWTAIVQAAPDASHYVPYLQGTFFTAANSPTIKRVMKVYLDNPRTVQAVLDTYFKLDANGIWCGFEHGTNVWIKVVGIAPQYTLTPYDGAATYGQYTAVYDPNTGNNFVSKQNGNTGHPLSDGAWWLLLPFPLELLELVLRGAYADALREDGQIDKAAAEEQALMSELQLKIGTRIVPYYDPMTDQSRPAPRYHLPSVAAVGGGS